MSYWVTCSINKGNMNGKKKCPPQQSSPLYFDIFSLKYSIIILLWLISSQKNHVSNQKSLNKSNNFQRN
jgi:hypothetical protein